MLSNKKLPTDIKKIIPFVTNISKKVLLLTKSKDESFKVKLALEEALTNAMRHGNALNKDKLVSIKIKANKEIIVMDVRDEGKGFDFRNLPNPTSPDNVNRPSGRGVFLIRRLMTKTEFYAGGSGIKMTRVFPKKS